MTDVTLLGLLDLGVAIAIYILLGRTRKEKKLKITTITDPVTTVRSIVISGKGLLIATIGWGITAILLTLSGLRSLLQIQTLEDTFVITVVCFILVFITTSVASYFTSKSEGLEE